MLTETSPCDNVLLEHRLAQELVRLGFLEDICPGTLFPFLSIDYPLYYTAKHLAVY